MIPTLTIPLPEGLSEETIRQLDQTAREAVAVQLYKDGKLSHGKFARFLGIGRGEVDTVLGKHGVVDEFTAEEVMSQARSILNAAK